MAGKKKAAQPHRHGWSARDAAPVSRVLVHGMLSWNLLRLLGERPMHGTEMIQTIFERTRHHAKPSPGSIYPLLRRMEENGLIAGEWQRSTAAPKRVYRLTRKGKAELPKMQARLLSDLQAARHIIDMHIAYLQQDAEGSRHA